MPILNIYVSNKIFVSFLQKTKAERERIRKEAANIIKEEVGVNV